jgi:hypothetical protein
VKYLKESTSSQGGVVYSLASGGGDRGRPALTAAAIACGFNAGDYDSPEVKKWFKFCRLHLTYGEGRRMGHDEYTLYYFSQAVYILGDKGWAKLFPDSKADDRLTWTKYRKALFADIVRLQSTDGSWQGAGIGPVYGTALYLTVLQLDKAALPIYQR